jgi:membrane protease YdiL (CAAX protease family)
LQSRSKPFVTYLEDGLVVPLARGIEDWASVLKGLIVGCLGIAVLALLATFTGAAHWNFKLPSFAAARILSNFFLTSIPEEGFYRGFIQNIFCRYFENIKLGKILALISTSILFAAAHYYWSPNLEILAFVFLASLLYGGVYLISGKIESAILTHFLLNFIHMTFFSYHAM